MIPDNLFEATFSQVQTKYRTKEVIELKTENGSSNNITSRTITQSYLGKMGNPNIIGECFASVCGSEMNIMKHFFTLMTVHCVLI